MPSLFPVTEIDTRVYEQELRDFLPSRMVDIHTHVWLDKFAAKEEEKVKRAVTWPALVAAESPIEGLLETYRLMFPGKEVTPLIFSSLKRGDDAEEQNHYVAECTARYGVPSLLYAFPEWSAEDLLWRILRGRHLGIKVYLNLSPAYLPEKEIRIFDFIPHHQLELLNSRKMILMLHVPRDGRLGDPVNLAQMLEIEERYPDLNVIYAHIGRAYCPEDFGKAFELLRRTRKLVMDFSANTLDEAMYRVLDAIGPNRVLFGSDLPILRMRMRRICEKGRYVNLVPKGMYGDVSKDPNMREVAEAESRDMTFFMYEELRAFKRAAARLGLGKSDIEAVFHGTARALIDRVGLELYGRAFMPTAAVSATATGDRI
ncbi:MAG: amidohydrolase family protein [Spirochaetota bacterium]